MKATEIRKLSLKDLEKKYNQLESELFTSRCNKCVGRLTDTSSLKFTRRKIARVKTVLNENNYKQKGK